MDNASAVAVMLGLAQAVMKSEIKPERTILLAFLELKNRALKVLNFI